MRRAGRDLSILALGVLPVLLLGIVWMRQAGVPSGVYLQNAGAVVVGAVIAGFGVRRRASTRAGWVLVGVAIVLLLATLVAPGVQGVHRWLRAGLTLYVAALVLPLVLAELERMRFGIALAVMLTVAAILALQPDAGQATAFAGACVVLLAMRSERRVVAVVGMVALLPLAALSFLRPDPLDAVPHVEEIAVRIGQQGALWQVAVVVALLLLLVPFLTRPGLPIAVYFALVIAASYWGNVPVPVLGYGVSPILGYFAGWAWGRGGSTR